MLCPCLTAALSLQLPMLEVAVSWDATGEYHICHENICCVAYSKYEGSTQAVLGRDFNLMALSMPVTSQASHSHFEELIHKVQKTMKQRCGFNLPQQNCHGILSLQ